MHLLEKDSVIELGIAAMERAAMERAAMERVSLSVGMSADSCPLPTSRARHGARQWLTWLALTLLLGCAASDRQADAVDSVSAAIGDAPVRDALESASMWRDAHTLLERRCVVCHGCYDAPCQLALSSITGVQRGASKAEIYNGSRLLAVAPTRLFVDARSEAEWRKKDFFSVLPGGTAGASGPGLLLSMLNLKQKNPTPAGSSLSEHFELDIAAKRECPRADEFAKFEKKHPLWGMPYALPALSPAEQKVLVQWVEAGAPGRDVAPVSSREVQMVARWERFLNQPSLKARLMSRYIYEHLFLASIHFDRDPTRASTDEAPLFFRMVRSRTPSGERPDEIATRRPFDDPGKGPFYYRIVPRLGSVLAKTHMPYLLDEAKLARYQELFLEPDYVVTELPSYAPASAANPFATYAALPVDSRYRFMLDEAHFTISGFIKGPVCRGQIALDVIDDRFWITFVDPRSPAIAREAGLLARSTKDLRLPAEQGSNGALVNWSRYARAERRHMKAKSEFLEQIATSPKIVTLAQIWDGDGSNDNAALTVLRHFDNATVIKGLAGGSPKSAWVVSYGILERIHYLLVAGFDVFGNIGHQLHTRLYMDYLRMEAEHNFLLLLPKAARRPLVDSWYRDTNGRTKDLVYGKIARFDQESGIDYQTAQPERELHTLLSEHLAPILQHKHDLSSDPDGLQTALAPITRLSGRSASLLPELSFLEVTHPSGEASHYTLLRDSAHTNVAHLFREDKRRRPSEDRVTLLRGFVGAYPHALFRVAASDLPAFVRALQQLDGESAYATLRDRYSLRRTSPDFWSHSDRIHDAYRAQEPLEAGLFDYNRLDDR